VEEAIGNVEVAVVEAVKYGAEIGQYEPFHKGAICPGVKVVEVKGTVYEAAKRATGKVRAIREPIMYFFIM
jgi:hypothetical protein